MAEHGLGWRPEPKQPAEEPFIRDCPTCKRHQGNIDKTMGQCFRCGAPLS